MGNQAAAFGHAIFCDDIRLEQGGKVTLVGVYSGVMFIHRDFPFSVPKFGIRVFYSERLESFGREPIAIRVSATWMPDGMALIEGDVPVDQLRAQGFQQTDALPPAEYATVGMHMMFAPLLIPMPGIIKVRAYRGSHKIRLGALRIGKPQPKGS